jgi:hypothetical protein
MTEQECDLVDALTGKESTTRDCVPEAVHGWHRTVRDGDWFATVIGLVQHGECGPSLLVDGPPLSKPERPTHVSLPKRPAGSRAEDIVVRLRFWRCQLVLDQGHRKLTRDRNGARRPIRLRRLPHPMPINLGRELDVRVIEVVKTHVLPREAKQLRPTSTSQCCEREQRSVWLGSRLDRLLQLLAFEDASPGRKPRLRPLRRQQQRNPDWGS